MTPMPSGDWPHYRKARDLAGTVFPVSEAVILATARQHGIGRKMGRTVIFSKTDCDLLYEVLPSPSSSFAAADPPTGSCAAPSEASALKKVQGLLTAASQRK